MFKDADSNWYKMSDYTNHLFPYLPKEKIRTLSCGHVIPKENLTALPVTKGPGGREFEFTFEKRMQPTMVRSLTIQLLFSSPTNGFID